MLSVIYLSLFFPLTTTETSLLVTKCLMLQYKISSYWLLCETQHGFILWVFEFEWFIGEYLVANVSENSQVQKVHFITGFGSIDWGFASIGDTCKSANMKCFLPDLSAFSQTSAEWQADTCKFVQYLLIQGFKSPRAFFYSEKKPLVFFRSSPLASFTAR